MNDEHKITLTIGDEAWIGEGPEHATTVPAAFALDMLEEGTHLKRIINSVCMDEDDALEHCWREMQEGVPEVDPLPDEVRAIAAAREEGGFVEHHRVMCQHVWEKATCSPKTIEGGETK